MYKVKAGPHTFVSAGPYDGVLSAILAYERDAEGSVAYEDGHFTDYRSVTVMRLRSGCCEPDRRFKPVSGYVQFDRRAGCYRFVCFAPDRSRVISSRLTAYRW